MANIFDIPTKQTYVDTYVPLPFQAIAAVGDKIQKQNADTESAMSALENEISKLNVVGQVETRPGEFKSTGYKEHKDNLLNNTHVKIKQIVDDHLSGKIDANQFQSSFGNLQKEILGDYEKLKFASANSKIIDEQAKLVRTNPKVAEDSSVLNLHYKENQRLLNNPFSNEYMGAAIGTVVDEVEAVNKFVRDNKDQVLSYVNQNKGGYHTQGYITGVSGERLRNEVHALFNEHEIGRQYRRRLDRAFDDGAYGTDEKGNPITFDTPTIINKKDKNGKVISSERSTFGRDRMRENEEKFTQAVILKGVSETPHLSTNVDVFAQEDRARKAAAEKEEEEKYNPMPNLQNPVITDKDKTTAKSGLKWLFGHDIDIIKDDGTAIKSSGIFASKYNVKQYDKDGKVKSTQIFYNSEDAHKAAKDLTYVISEEKSDAKDMERKLNNHYTELVTVAKGLGMNLPMKANDKSKVNYDLLQKQLSDYGQNMEISGNSTAAFQARFSTNLSNYFLGEVTADSNGKIGFKKSPSLGNSKITDLTTGQDVNSKEEIAKDGAIKGINYYADQPGTYRVDSKDKAYNLDPGDNTLKSMTKNTHSFTQGILKARQGKQTSKTVIDNNNNTIGDYAVSIVNNLKENFKTIPSNNPQGLLLANHLNENLNKLNGYEPINISPSDILIKKGPRRGTPKYNYIAYENKGFGTTNEADDLILRIDAESGQTEVITLGDVHSDERDYLQKTYENAFEPTKIEKR